ncbi:MAG: IS21-like element helper ATPase IstB [Actinomycetota bacterium]
MLVEPMIEKMQAMKLFGMRDALAEQMTLASYDELSFEERIGMLVDREWIDRENRKLERRMKAARLKIAASMEDIDYRANRGLDAPLMRSLADCRWVRDNSSILVVGPTGTGKTYLSCALADQAMRKGYSCLYFRAPRLFSALLMARADGSWPRFLSKLEKADLIVVDDFGLAPLTDGERRQFLEVLEDRSGTKATIVASQLPVSSWHDVIGEPTVADAILDRLVHNAHRIELKGASMRKQRSQKPKEKGKDEER